VILDNSAYELKKPLEAEILLDLVEEIGFQEVVAPDYFGDGKKTISSTFEFLEKYSERKVETKIQAVAQGSDVEDWKQCFIVLMPEWGIDVLGISITANKLTSRLDLLKWINSSYSEPDLKEHEFHALGLDDPRELVTITKNYPWLTRNDSSTAVAQGMSSLRLNLDGSLPKGKIFMDFENTVADKNREDILWNIAVLRKITRKD
jgi:hypothetical protein